MNVIQQIGTPKPLGKTGLTVPPIIYGTSFMGNLYHELPAETKLEIMKNGSTFRNLYQ